MICVCRRIFSDLFISILPPPPFILSFLLGLLAHILRSGQKNLESSWLGFPKAVAGRGVVSWWGWGGDKNSDVNKMLGRKHKRSKSSLGQGR